MSDSILAHFDGERILLDEPFEVEPNPKLLIQVLPKGDDEREQWLTLSKAGLQMRSPMAKTITRLN